MYLLIAAQMQRQFDAMDDPQQRTEFATGLIRFLDRLRTESNDPNTIIWAGKTLMELADSFASQSMDAQAKPMFDMAIEALDRASKMGIKDQALVNELKRQQAIAKRGLGQFEESYAELVELLRLSPNAWNTQMDAARTLQVWGVQKKKPEQLAKALGGSEKFRDPKTRRQSNLVWGWARLAEVLKNKPKFSDPYYRSLYAAIETRLEYGLIEQKQEVIAAALKQIDMTKARDEQMGGTDWISKFEKLEQRIRNSMSTVPATAANK
jgi:tetratricopeptide (TPR) repeat protein